MNATPPPSKFGSTPPPPSSDELLFGWDPTVGIVSVWANQDGHAIVWRRVEGTIVRETERFHPWLLAARLDDLEALGDALAGAGARRSGAVVRYRELDGDDASYRYLLTARSGRMLTRLILDGASRRMKRAAMTFSELDGYYRVGPVEQYL